MAEVTNELLLEVLKSMQGQLGGIEHRLDENNSRLYALSEHVRGLAPELHAAHTDIANIYQSVANLDRRVRRIEHRLDRRGAGWMSRTADRQGLGTERG